jgi:hypothetical protein
MVNYGLTHGVHKFEMYALSDISNEPTKSVIKNIIFVNPDDSTPIISCNFF